MGNDAIGAHFQCPFYLATSNNHITCEGILKNTTARHTFKSKAKKQVYSSKYCCNFDNYENCLHYQTLIDLYESGLRK